MLKTRGLLIAVTVIATLSLGACSDSGLLGGPATTAALPEKPKVDPACVALASQIDQLRKEGVAERVEAAAQGKSATVNVKRESLAKVAELNKANAAFQTKCGTVTPGAVTAAREAPSPPASVTKAVSSAPAIVKPKTAAIPSDPAVPAVAVDPASGAAKQAAKQVAQPPKTE